MRTRVRLVLTVVVMVVTAGTLAGCVGSVKLRHPPTKQEVTCGPYWFAWDHGVDFRNRCVEDYQAEGYERVQD
jgi:hypothetical protein